MKYVLKVTCVAITATALMACGGSDDDNSDSSPNTNSGTQGETSSENPTNAQNDVFGPAQIVLAECGNSNVSNSVADNVLPTPFVLDQVVEGQLVKDSSVLNHDLWQITLEPGNYHLIADSWLTSGDIGTKGLEISSLTGDTEERIMFQPSGDGYDTRAYSYLEVLSGETKTLKVEPIYDATTNYQLAIYANGSPVVSPRFTRCPPTPTISLDETQLVQLPRLTSIDDYRWYRMNLPAGVYNLDASTSSDQLQTNQYIFELVQKFGEKESRSRIGSDVENGTFLSSTFQFTVLENSDIWIRIHTTTDQRDAEFREVEFTVRR